MKKKLLVILIFFMFTVMAYGRPQYAMLTGNKCISCHFTAQGGGLRSELGWYSRKDASLFKWSKKMMEFGNTAANGMITFGVDSRYQYTRVGDPSNMQDKFYFMQLSPHLGIKATSWLAFEGSYNFYSYVNIIPGQARGSASMIIQPDASYPQLRVGFFQPSIGVRYDDHTVFVRDLITSRGLKYVIPMDYAEAGAELNYEGLKWLSLTLGAFNSSTLSQITIFDKTGASIPIVEDKSLATLARIAFLPRLFENMINFNIGASYYNIKDFDMKNIFLGIGLTDRISLLTEYMIMDKKDLLTQNNFMIDLSYQLLDAMILSVRAERAMMDDKTKPEGNQKFNTNQYVFGASFFPLPYIELRPEYRIYDRENVPSFAGFWAFQLHICF